MNITLLMYSSNEVSKVSKVKCRFV